MEANYRGRREELEQFLGQAVTDMGAAMNGALVAIGGQLGIWRARER